jgi:uncharacterized protein
MNDAQQDRRQFLKTSLAGMAGAAGLARANRMTEGMTDGKAPDGVSAAGAGPVMRTLGRTGLRVPVVSMGTGDTQDPGLVRAAIDGGVRLLATSSYYGNGENERMLSRVLKDRKRDSVVVVTSVMADGYDFKAANWTAATKAGPFLKKFEGSLKRLEVDCIDIFLLPFAAKRESVFFEPLLKAMEQIKKQGKARFIGVATHQFEPEAIRAAQETGVYDVVLTALNFRRENRVELLQAIESASRAGMGVIAMKTMAGAFWDKEKTRPINATAALKWAIESEHVHTAVPGLTSHDQLAADLSVMKNPALTDPERAELKLAFDLRPDAPYCQQCGRCVPQCRHGLDIPTSMRAYMYAHGHGNLRHARRALAWAGGPAAACADCVACSVRCAMGSDVKGKMLDIARLASVPEDFLG